MYFKYGLEEINHLKNQDPLLGKAMEQIGPLERKIDPDIFYSLISSIISQQISTSAARTVKERLKNLLGNLEAEAIFKADIEAIQQCGMSMRKAGYIKGIAEAVISRQLDIHTLPQLSDQEVIAELTKLHGVGIWTAEMLLIHSLQRPDIISYHDLGIRRGIMTLYGLDQLTKKQFEQYRKIYSPCGTVASIYLWEISSRPDFVLGSGRDF